MTKIQAIAKINKLLKCDIEGNNCLVKFWLDLEWRLLKLVPHITVYVKNGVKNLRFVKDYIVKLSYQ